jgi:hypothetical protein
MNTLDERIQQALRAQAEQLTEQDLTPMQPPAGSRPRANWTLPLLVAAAVVLLTAGGTLAIRAATAPDHSPAPPASRPAPTGTAPAPTASGPVTTQPPTPAPSRSSTPTPTPTPSGLPAGYEPLWPFDAAGSGQPAGDAPSTALAFTRQYLGFTEITTVTSSRYEGQEAHIGVGYRNPPGKLATAAVLHLIRIHTAGDGGGWEVVGSADTTLTLEQPAYGSVVSSPMTVGGRVTGVDENIVVTVRSQTGGVVGRAPGLPAGGDQSPWHTTVSFTGSGVLTVVAYTGGHLQTVERFAIQGVHA